MNKPHDVWGDDEDRDLEDQASPRPQHTGLSLHRLRLGVRRKSTSDSKGGEVPSLSTSSTLRESVAEPTVVLSKQDKSFRHDLTHSKSNADIHNCKAEWGAEIVAHGSMQDSLGRFRKDVEEYEAKAGLRQWEDTLLPLAETNFQELNELMKRTAEKEQSRKHRAWRWYDGFSAVALEYSKLLDVVMEACPDYVSMAWGTMKILLVADINHQNLKENVRRCLIDIGGRLGIVNQLLCYSPTEKMVEAVALLHASFSKFLGKALKYYCKSKLLSIAQAFTFPWETRFAKTVNMIDVRFNHIQEIAHASHFHVTIQNNHVLHSINDCVHKQGSALQRDYSPARLLSETKKKMKDEVREELRADFKKEILTALEDFSPQWLQHFEEIISRKHRKRNPEPLNYHNDARGYTAAGLDGPAALPDVDYLATHAVSSEDVLKFRDSCFPSCRQSDHTISFLRICNRRLRAYEYRQCVAVMRDLRMQKWLRQQRSAFLWIDSYSGTKVADWTTSLVLDLIDHTSQLTSFMTLRFCCQKTHQQQPPVTVALVLQSLISQVLESKYECFSDRSPFFTRQRFKAAGNDTELLWTVFHQVLEAAKAPCFLIIDRIGLMQARSPKDENMVFLFIKKLNKLLSLDHMLIKILLTTRVGNNKGSSPALDMAHLAPDAILIRWHHTGSGAVRPYARLPEANPLETIKNSIDSTTGDPFLSEPDTDSESEVENTCSRALMSQSTLVASTKPQDSDEDSFEGSDFGRDPFAEESSDDSFMNTAKSTTLTRKSTMQTISGPNSLDESDTADDWAEDIFGESDGDEDADTLLKSPVTPKTPKIVVAPAEYCPSISKSSSRSIKDEGEIRDGDISSEDGFRSQPFQPNKPNEPRLAPDSDADSDLDF